MKVVILAGGHGTRISEETELKPKPMVEIGGVPLLWHIMKMYSHYSYNEFIILLGYKGYVIKEFFMNYFLHTNDVTIDIGNNQIDFHNNRSENWKVTLVDTGLNTMTGGRIKRIAKYINNERFMLTYGDGLSNVDIPNLIKFHTESKKLLTLTAVQPEGRFGALSIDNKNSVTDFFEKPVGDGNWINGGFFVCEPEILSFINDDQTVFEKEPLENLVKQQQLSAYKHYGFWKCMDTLRDKNDLERLWQNNSAEWKLWN